MGYGVGLKMGSLKIAVEHHDQPWVYPQNRYFEQIMINQWLRGIFSDKTTSFCWAQLWWLGWVSSKIKLSQIDPGILPSISMYHEHSWVQTHSCEYGGFLKCGNVDTPKSSISIGFSIINHPFWDPHLYVKFLLNPQFLQVNRPLRLCWLQPNVC